MPRRKKTTRAQADSRGLTPAQAAAARETPAAVQSLVAQVERHGGRAVAPYRDPLGGHWLVLALLPLDAIAPTPFQRDLSATHVERLRAVIDQLDTFLDPVIAVPAPDAAAGAGFWTPNGHHRLNAMRALGARTITALVSPDPNLAYRIFALNTEKAHNLKERALEAVRMARGLAEIDPAARERDYALELEEGALITLGFAYEQRARFAGGAYGPALKASDKLLNRALSKTLPLRAGWAERLLALDARVTELVAELKARGFESPYLRNFVVARLRPFRRRGSEAPAVEDLLDHMERAAARFNVDKIQPADISRAAGGGEE